VWAAKEDRRNRARASSKSKGPSNKLVTRTSKREEDDKRGKLEAGDDVLRNSRRIE
jgi:hypothetical protein